MSKLPIGIDINNLIDDLRIVSWEASDILLYYSKILKNPGHAKEIIKTQNEEDPLTLADLKVNDLIIERINANYKETNWGLLSEENVKKESDKFENFSNWLWILDPLDGTKDFIQGTKNYAMHLALNYEKKPYIGIVLIPERNELWIANGESTWCENKEGKISKPSLNNNKVLKEMTIVTSKNHRNDALNNLIKKVGFRKVKTMGSIGCKITSIIRGECDIYISLSLPGESSPKDWDFAAPEAILRAAGGSLTNLDNQDLTYESKSFRQGGIIVASNNREAHGSLCLKIKEIIKKFDLYPIRS